MANKFQIQIEAIDRFSKVLQRLNDKASKATRPIQNTYRQLGALGREMHLDTLAAGVARVSTLAPTMARNLGLSLGPLESLLGVGAAGGMIGTLGAAAAAMGALTVKTTQAGFETQRTAGLFDVSAQDLQRFQYAAKRAGVDSDVATAALGSLGDTLKSAAFGRDPQALNALARFGVSIVKNKDGMVDVQATLEQIEDVMHNMQSQQQRNTLADILSIPHDVLPMLQQGSRALRDLGDYAERVGAVQGPQALKWAKDYNAELARTGTLFDGVSNRLSALAAPEALDALRWMNDWIEKSTRPPPRFITGHVGALFPDAPASASTSTPAPAASSATRHGARALGWAPRVFVIPKDTQAQRDAEEMEIIRGELSKETDSATRDALQRELYRVQRSVASEQSAASAATVEHVVTVRVEGGHNLPAGTKLTAYDQLGQILAGASRFHQSMTADFP